MQKEEEERTHVAFVQMTYHRHYKYHNHYLVSTCKKMKTTGYCTFLTRGACAPAALSTHRMGPPPFQRAAALRTHAAATLMV